MYKEIEIKFKGHINVECANNSNEWIIAQQTNFEVSFQENQKRDIAPASPLTKLKLLLFSFVLMIPWNRKWKLKYRKGAFTKESQF